MKWYDRYKGLCINDIDCINKKSNSEDRINIHCITMNPIYCSKVRLIYCMYILILSGTAMPATEEAPVEV